MVEDNWKSAREIWEGIELKDKQRMGPAEPEPPTDAEARDHWRRFGAPPWAIPIEQLEMLKATHESKLTRRKFVKDAEGNDTTEELLSSKILRAVEAVALAKAENGCKLRNAPWTYGDPKGQPPDATGPWVGWRQAQQMPGSLTGSERALANKLALERFHDGTPRALGKMGVGERLVEALADLVDTEPVVWVRTWLTTGKRWAFVLTGPGGTGKSVALAEALSQHCRETIRLPDGTEEPQWRTRKGLYVLASHFVAGPAFGPEGEEHMRKHTGAELLCIDDLGTETLTEVGKDLLYRLLDDRYRAKRRTLIASNLSWEEMVRRYGMRPVRRLEPGKDWGATYRTVKTQFSRPGAS